MHYSGPLARFNDLECDLQALQIKKRINKYDVLNIGWQGKTSIDAHQPCVDAHRLITEIRVLLLLRSGLCSYTVHRHRQLTHSAVNLVLLLQPEQPDTKGHEISPFVTLQLNASGSLQTLVEEFFA